MVVVAQLVRVADCGSEGRGFESPIHRKRVCAKVGELGQTVNLMLLAEEVRILPYPQIINALIV